MPKKALALGNMDERDIWRSTKPLIDQHGVDTAVGAAMRADAMKDAGDLDGLREWKRIVAAIEELTSSDAGSALACCNVRNLGQSGHRPTRPKPPVIAKCKHFIIALAAQDRPRRTDNVAFTKCELHLVTMSCICSIANACL